jgi:DNA-binding Xre family transcriptional regulator
MSAGTGDKVSYLWHLRMVMAARGMFATSDLLPLLAERGVVLSREQVYRLVAKVPERISLGVLAALCDALDCSPAELIEPVAASSKAASATAVSTRAAVREIKPRRAQVGPEPK